LILETNGVKKHRLSLKVIEIRKNGKSLSTFSSNSSGQLNVLGHDGHSLGVDGAKVAVFEETNQISFSSFLKGSNSRGLEAKICLVVLSDFTNKSLEGQFSDQQFSRLLVSSDFSQSDGTYSRGKLKCVTKIVIQASYQV
jgi:histone H3